MSRYIDAELSQKIADAELDLKQAGVVQYVLSHTPTINPEDLRSKGKWEPYYENIEIYNAGGFAERKQTGWICGKCKSKKSFMPHPTSFCPNCGARMEE